MRRIALLVLLLFVATACTPSYNDPKPPRPTKGNPKAQVTVEEFGDFQCPACGAAYPLFKQLQEKYGERTLWKYYHFPLTQIHPFAFNASLASECANDQGKFWEYHDLLYENQTRLTNGDLNTYAQQLGLKIESFKACYKSRTKTATVRADMAFGDSKGINSTPSIVLNGQIVDDWTTLGERLAAFLATSTPS